MPRKPRLLSADDFLIQPSSIPGAGQGLFPLITVYAGDTIGPYTGRLITDRQANRAPYASSRYMLWICRDHWIVGEGKQASHTRYINHGQRPNARFVVSTRWKTARVEAIKRIRPGEEVFLDYGPDYWAACGIDPTPTPAG